MGLIQLDLQTVAMVYMGIIFFMWALCNHLYA